MGDHRRDSYFLSRLAADALAADLSSFAEFSPFPGLIALFAGGLFFTDVLFFTGFTFGDLADFFAIVARNYKKKMSMTKFNTFVWSGYEGIGSSNHL